MNPAAFALLRLASPQLPIGGYSYSQGLEMAVEQQRVQDETSAGRWLADQLLLNLARFEAPLLLAHCRAATVGAVLGLEGGFDGFDTGAQLQQHVFQHVVVE